MPTPTLHLLARFSLSLALSPLGCGLISFDVDTALPAETIPQAVPGSSLTTLEQPVTVAAQDTGPAESATVKILTFTATSGGTFDFLQAVHLFVSAPNLPEVEVANLLTVPIGVTSITLDAVDDVNLLPYLKGGFVLRSVVEGSHPAENFSFVGELTVHVGL